MLILLVEDDQPLAASIAGALGAQGWRVDISPLGEPVPASLMRDDYDALILDIGLPGIDGLETLRRVRAQGSRLPVLMLTARDTVEQRVHGLEVGADDYLVKPFAPVELVARLRALTRRHENRVAEVLSVARLRFDPKALRAWVGDEPVKLSRRECDILQYLMLKAGRVVQREQLVTLVPGWSGATSDNALDLLVSRLRTKIEPAGVRLRTVRGLGYLLDAGDDA
ncbi:response regulator transcription factor [Rhizobacter sp. OV335]|uniref:response regulator transcription factor n=1 Tax=Rhizobacter sp. OV335 TaxID=1500264 RepID=UPI000910D6FF|nr:response regulator transcription factor [Rhizobacter sp. OV335]SHN09138.1 DNA-binding response regulator, OmpR family, contains REC and winged-helix (wHTH) domain [Rhizobacter sp. OV335]